MKKSGRFKALSVLVLLFGTIINGLSLIINHDKWWSVLGAFTLVFFIGAWIYLFASFDEVIFKSHDELLAERENHMRAKKAHEHAEQKLLNKVLNLK